jgi:exodeoxyribonuclease V alpha subunit
VGDRVIQMRNNYDKDVYNGDMGMITQMDVEYQKLDIDFEGRVVQYDFLELDELTHAFAISVHKSQGSEFPVVVFPVMTTHYMMLQRNLLYTAVTRARNLCVLTGSRRAIGIAVHNNKVARRFTALEWRLGN